MEFPLHETLPLGPRVDVHVEFPVQARLQDLPQDPSHAVWFSQLKVQLPLSPPHMAALNPQLMPELQEHVDPLQVGGGGELELPHATREMTQAISRYRMGDISVGVRRYLMGEREGSDCEQTLTSTCKPGMLWFGGWLFTMGFAKLVWWKAVFALVIWRYFQGATVH